MTQQAAPESVGLMSRIPAPVISVLRRRDANVFFLFFVLIAAIVYFSIESPYFLSDRNAFNIGRAVSITGIAAAFATLLMISGGLDLSIGAIMNASGLTAAVILAETDQGIVVAFAIALGISTFIGFANGIIVTKIGVNPIIATIGMQFVVRGMTLATRSGSALVRDSTFLSIGQGELVLGSLEIPVPVILMLLTMLLAYLTLRFTQFGKYIYAIGDNASACRRAGINVDRYRIALYTISGVGAGFAGLVLTGLTGAGIPYAAGSELSVISAVILGGVSLSGGVGLIQGTLLGVLLVGVLKNGMTLLNINANWQMVVEGSVLMIAVSLDQLKQRI